MYLIYALTPFATSPVLLILHRKTVKKLYSLFDDINVIRQCSTLIIFRRSKFEVPVTVKMLIDALMSRFIMI